MAIDKLLLVDLNHGSYTDKHVGHELFNFCKNSLTGKYYGYIPPRDGVGIEALDPFAKDFVDGVLVIFTQAMSRNDTRRIIIGFSTNTRVFRYPQNGNHLNRGFWDKTGLWETADYHMISDDLTDLSSAPNKFIIETREYNPYMFRKQRTFLDQPIYSLLRKNIIAYVENYINLDRDFDEEQSSLQEAEALTASSSLRYSAVPDEYISSTVGQIVKKNPALAKRVLEANNYECLCSRSHNTFLTKRGKPYMEGHHLIPCTVSNSQSIQVEFGSKLDREENIVCLCPTCHRAIHFGDNTTRREILIAIYEKQKQMLEKVRINIDLDTIFSMYGLNEDN